MNNLNQVDHSIISELSKYDSATVQNAAILVRGYINHTEDYTGPNLTQYIESKKNNRRLCPYFKMDSII